MPSLGRAMIMLVPLLIAMPAMAQERRCAEGTASAGRLVAVDGNVTINGMPVIATPSPLCAGETIGVARDARATVQLQQADTVLRLDAESRLEIAPGQEEGSGFVRLISGTLYFLSQVRRSLTIETPYVTAGVDGTEVLLRVGQDTDILVIDGDVALSRGGVPLPERLVAGQEIRVSSDSATPGGDPAAPGQPWRLLAADRLAWTLSYPPVVDAAGTGQIPQTVEAARLLQRGQVAEAAAVLGTIGAETREAGLAAALRATILVPQGQLEPAADAARVAVRLAPDAASPRLAWSYVWQARFNLDEALEDAELAVKFEPANGLARARLAEIHLMRGERAAALREAEAAAALEDTSLARAVQGFARLAALDTTGALDAFDAALARDDGNPTAYLGKGLALIRRNQIEEGRAQIEVAAALDPTSSLTRSYLGKALDAENRSTKAAEQLAIAKALDPSDPTPWLYDALLKQRDNRPVAALRDLDRSIALNDNRAPFRSRLLLDQDVATRSAELGQIYRELGLEAQGADAGARALTADPGNAGAHRLLADSYRGVPRLEVARTSQLLQSQLFDPLSASPLQSSMPYADLNLVTRGAASEVGFNEYGSLFRSDGVKAAVTGAVGSFDTVTGEAIGTATAGRTVLSASQFYYRTDGFRQNADQHHDLTSIFGQTALTPELSVQAEYRRRRTDMGDIVMNFSPDDFLDPKERKINQDTARLGLRYQTSPASTFIGSLMYSDRRESLNQVQEEQGVAVTSDFDNKSDGVIFELQHIYQAQRVRLVSGGGTSDIERDQKRRNGFVPPPPGGDPPPTDQTSDIDQHNIYGYLDLHWPDPVTWTFGLSLDSVKSDSFDKTRLGPKIGVRYELSEALQLRAAYTDSTMRFLLTDQTLEPTQVAGFNQLFDDFSGTHAKRVGIGADLRLNERWFATIEASRRWLDTPESTSGTDSTDFETQREMLVLGSLNWLATDSWTFGITPSFDRFEFSSANDDEPREVTTLKSPLSARYFDPSGFFGIARVTPFWQSVERPSGTSNQGDGGDLLVDLAAGYRLPRQRGVLSIEVNNLFDSDFRYQDENYRTREDFTSGMLPERSVFARATFNF